MLICSISIIIFSFLFIIFSFIFIMFGYELFCVEFFESDSVKYYIESRKNATNQTCPDIWTIYDLAKCFLTSNISNRNLTLRKYLVKLKGYENNVMRLPKDLGPIVEIHWSGTNRNKPEQTEMNRNKPERSGLSS